MGVALAAGERGVLLAELGAERGRGPTMLASAAARELEERSRATGLRRLAARGRLCWLGLPAGEEGLGELAPRSSRSDPPSSIVHLPARLWRAALDRSAGRCRSGLLRADLPSDRALAALAVIELRERRLQARVAARPLGQVASRRALAGLEAGGAAARRVARLARGLVGPAAGAARRARPGAAADDRRGVRDPVLRRWSWPPIGGAATGTARAQRAADLVALSGARSLRDDFPTAVHARAPPRRRAEPAAPGQGASISPGPSRVRPARCGAKRRRSRPASGRLPRSGSFAPVRVQAEVTASSSRRSRGRRSPRASPARSPSIARGRGGGVPAGVRPALRPMASGGGYSGPLAYRQGKPMRPDVAAAFDRMAAAARRPTGSRW